MTPLKQIEALKQTIKYFRSQIGPHDCGWMYTTIDEKKIYTRWKVLMEEIDLKEENLKLRRDITNLEQQVLESHAERIKTLKINQELTNEMVLIKGITITNSPELREANKKIKKLEETLERLTNPVQKARESGL